MTDLLALPVWLLLSWLLRQVENGFSDNETAEQDISDTQTDSEVSLGPPEDPFDPIVQLVKIAIAAFSVLLLGLSISAYKKTAIKGILYAAGAFGLFAVQLFFDYAEDVIEGWEQPYNDVIFYGMTLAILVLFFMAVVRRK